MTKTNTTFNLYTLNNEANALRAIRDKRTFNFYLETECQAITCSRVGGYNWRVEIITDGVKTPRVTTMDSYELEDWISVLTSGSCYFTSDSIY